MSVAICCHSVYALSLDGHVCHLCKDVHAMVICYNALCCATARMETKLAFYSLL